MDIKRIIKMFDRFDKYLCYYVSENGMRIALLNAPDEDTAKFFVQLKSMEEDEVFVPAEIIDISKHDPSHHISLTIH